MDCGSFAREIILRFETKRFASSIEAHRAETKRFASSIEAHRAETKRFASSIEAHRAETKRFASSIEAHRAETKRFASSIEAHRAETKRFASSIEVHRAEAKRFASSIGAHRAETNWSPLFTDLAPNEEPKFASVRRPYRHLLHREVARSLLESASPPIAVPRPQQTSTKHLHRRASLPGILGDILRQRWKEFRYPGFSPFALEIVCFDLRIRREHELSLYFAQQPTPVQDAIDRELYRQYRPGADRNGLLVQAINQTPLPAARPAPRGAFACFRGYIRFSEVLAPCIETRWQEAGYSSFSDYVTGLIRYDLLLLGPHIYFNGEDTDPEILASLDRGTVAEFHENRQPKRIYLDRLLDLAAGRALTVEERRAAIGKLAEDIIERAQQADRRQAKEKT